MAKEKATSKSPKAHLAPDAASYTHLQIAVKVIDDRGNELLVVKKLAGAAKAKG